MATFHIREDSVKKVAPAEHKTVNKLLRLQVEQQEARAPLRCVTNATKAEAHAACSDKQAEAKAYVDKAKAEVDEKHCKKESSPQGDEINSCLSLECLKLIGKENIPFRKYSDEWDCYTPDDLLCTVEYGTDIWDYLVHMETKMQKVKPHYMTKQEDVTLQMRSVLVDWLVSVAQEYNISEATIHLSVNYIDRFLSYMAVAREKFQLVGAAAMILAMKVEEVNTLQAEEWTFLTGQVYTVNQFNRMEQLLLKVLKFEMNPPTAVAFIQQLCMAHGLDKKTLYMAMYLSELVLLEGDVYLQYLPSKLASASVVLARYILQKQDPYYEKLESFSGYKFAELNPVIKKQHITYRESPTKAQQTIQTKYKNEKYLEVATITPTALDF